MSVLGGGVIGAPHVPCTEPGGTTQAEPVQQSAVVVQTVPVGSQEIALQLSAPVEPGTQGMPSQQSAAEAQLAPCMTHAVRP